MVKPVPSSGAIEPMPRTREDRQRVGRALSGSLETPMACGVGIVLLRSEGKRQMEDYSRVCMDGPVFDAAQLIWE